MHLPHGDPEAGISCKTNMQAGTSAGEAAIAAELLADVDAAPIEYVQRYRERFAHVLNGDNASELFDTYARSAETRATRVAVVRRAAAQVVERTYQTLLSEPIPCDRVPLVVFTSGGNGSGKSTSVSVEAPEHIVFDSTLSQFQPSSEKIDHALAAGHEVDVRHLARDPVAAWRGVLHRAMHEGMGRTVTLTGHIQTHRGAREVFLRLRERFSNDRRVRFLIWQNTSAGLRRQPLDWLRRQRYAAEDVNPHAPARSCTWRVATFRSASAGGGLLYPQERPIWRPHRAGGEILQSGHAHATARSTQEFRYPART